MPTCCLRADVNQETLKDYGILYKLHVLCMLKHISYLGIGFDPSRPKRNIHYHFSELSRARLLAGHLCYALLSYFLTEFGFLFFSFLLRNYKLNSFVLYNCNIIHSYITSTNIICCTLKVKANTTQCDRCLLCNNILIRKIRKKIQLNNS